MKFTKDNRISRIIKNAYGRKYDLNSYEIMSRHDYYLSRLHPLVSFVQKKWVQITSLIIAVIVTIGSIYYYNLLVTTQQDALAAGGKVEALMQRRNDISINLSKAVLDYSKYESGVFTAIVSLRSMLPKSGLNDPEFENLLKKLEQADGISPEKLKGAQFDRAAGKKSADALSPFANLLAIAEQYPDLKLSTTFQSLMTALIDVEKDMADERIKFNDAVNIYTTNMAKFPTNIYAAIFGFKDLAYFKAEEEAKKLVPIKY
ncbi:MAG TPA: LemA family protein [Anaerolineae bacterium]|nr:LemA family protein [Anaerolineae bacterium]